jgi:hypothetical protein
VSGVRGFAWADVDGDGNPDAAIVDGARRLHAHERTPESIPASALFLPVCSL